MVTLTQLATSSMPIQLQVAAIRNGAAYDPSNGGANPVAIAFVPQTSPPGSPDPTPGEYNAAYWETDGTSPASYWASIMVGPNNGGIPLAVGSYVAVVKITDPAATPVLQGAYVRIV
jgi:hypothetical protein